jgi:hypothetical protein
MRIFQAVLFSVCVGLLVVVAMTAGLRKPLTPGPGYIVRPQIDAALERAVHLTDAHNYDAALKLVDDASAFSNKTNLEVGEIGQVRSFVAERRGLASVSPP